MFDLKKWIAKVTEAVRLFSSGIVFGQNAQGDGTSYVWQLKVKSCTSNSSGLINLHDNFGISASNAAGITVNCSTSGYKVSGITLWNNMWYAILSPFNSATPSANTTVTLVVSYFRSGTNVVGG